MRTLLLAGVVGSLLAMGPRSAAAAPFKLSEVADAKECNFFHRHILPFIVQEGWVVVTEGTSPQSDVIHFHNTNDGTFADFDSDPVALAPALGDKVVTLVETANPLPYNPGPGDPGYAGGGDNPDGYAIYSDLPGGSDTDNPGPCPNKKPLADLDHIQCYEVDHAKKSIPVTLVNQFGTSTATLVDARRLCNPADKNGEDPSAPNHAGHYVGYTLRKFGPFTKVKLTVTNQFGTFGVLVVRPVRLLVPSAKSLSSAPPPLDSATAAFLDHFECYKIKIEGAPGVSAVTVQDEFGAGQERLLKGEQLCVAVDKNGSGIPDPSAKFLCYRSRPISGTLHGPSGAVFVNNQFGSDTFQIVTHADQLCVPSSPSGAFVE